MMPATVLIAVPDLLFRSKIREATRPTGVEAVFVSNPTVMLDRARSVRPQTIVIDLGDDRLGAIDLVSRLKADPELRTIVIVGFFPHVRIDLKNAAKEAGCDVILPRSAVVSALPGILSGEAPNPMADES